jgi:hypothetical protein
VLVCHDLVHVLLGAQLLGQLITPRLAIELVLGLVGRFASARISRPI